MNCLNVSAMEALGGRCGVQDDVGGQHEEGRGGGRKQVPLTGEGYEEMPMLGIDSASFINAPGGLDNSASYVLQQDSKVDAMPYNESSIISNEYAQ